MTKNGEKMMKAIVVYYSKTGNTKKISETIAQELQTNALARSNTMNGSEDKETDPKGGEKIWLQATQRHFVPCLATLGHIIRDKRFAYTHPNSSFGGNFVYPENVKSNKI
uniref:Flavodoxin-like domain-containing protein n=1 Tax=Candidatus Methanophagaceae archaeon ANME-1 ERB6 TaxID=2759912 RepID=A0A7G9Z156_9EURY|nr:hypothetical protein OHMBFCMF_00009 [Methanosarcinales archaeon ANME-1 ERB6]